MTAVAAARFRGEQLEIPLVRCLWADLPAVIDERFDVVLCIGNSLVHAAGREAMIGALIGLREMIRPGGHLVVDSRNWEKLHAERKIVQLADSAVTRHGRRCIVLYAWEIPDRLDLEHIAHIVLIFEDGSRIQPHEYRIASIPGSRLMPLGEFPKHVGDLDPNAEIVIHCKMGGRSARACAVLRQAGFERVYNLKGGILAWSDKIDPSVPKY